MACHENELCLVWLTFPELIHRNSIQGFIISRPRYIISIVFKLVNEFCSIKDLDILNAIEIMYLGRDIMNPCILIENEMITTISTVF